MEAGTKGSSPKIAVHRINNKMSRNTHEVAHFHQNDRHEACSFTGNECITGIPQIYPILIVIIRVAISNSTIYNKS